MNLENLIPKNKFDSKTVELLSQFTFEEIEKVIPKLLEWLNAGNWPVSRSMANFLLTLPSNKLAPYLLEVLNGDDKGLKYFMIVNLVSGKQSNFDPTFLKEIQRIASNPSEIELASELNVVAQDALDYLTE